MVEERDNVKRKERLMQIIRDDGSEEMEDEVIERNQEIEREQERPQRKKIFARSKEKY